MEIIEEIKIGSQIWMKNNLCVRTYNNGDPIDYVNGPIEWNEKIITQQESICSSVNYNPYNDRIYGCLYSWKTVNDDRGLAPDGWRIPSNKDIIELKQFLGNDSTKIKSKHGWRENDYVPDSNLNDSAHFTARPAGMIFSDGQYDDLGNYAYFWLSDYSTPLKKKIQKEF